MGSPLPPPRTAPPGAGSPVARREALAWGASTRTAGLPPQPHQFPAAPPPSPPPAGPSNCPTQSQHQGVLIHPSPITALCALWSPMAASAWVPDPTPPSSALSPPGPFPSSHLPTGSGSSAGPARPSLPTLGAWRPGRPPLGPHQGRSTGHTSRWNRGRGAPLLSPDPRGHQASATGLMQGHGVGASKRSGGQEGCMGLGSGGLGSPGVSGAPCPNGLTGPRGEGSGPASQSAHPSPTTATSDPRE